MNQIEDVLFLAISSPRPSGSFSFGSLTKKDEGAKFEVTEMIFKTENQSRGYI